MKAILYHRSGSLEGRKTRFEGEVLRLGRRPDNDAVFAEAVVSSYHAEIRLKSEAYGIVDLESTNGTFVNGKRVQKARLEHKDTVELGENGPVFEFRIEQHPGTAEGPRLVPVGGTWAESAVELSHGRHLVGRGNECDIVAGRHRGSVVSSEHAEISVHSDYCEIRDLGSSNGTFLNGESIESARLQDGDRLEFGDGGPVCEFRWSGRASRSRGSASEDERLLRKLDRAKKGGPAGDHTMMMLKVVDKYSKRRRRPWVAISAALIVIATGALIGAYFMWQRLERVTTERKFYDTRTLDARLVAGGASLSAEEKSGLRERRRQLEDEYEKYLVKVGWYKNKTEQEQAVMRMARRLGEMDLEMPPGFYETVMEYVQKWKSTPRLRLALERARKNDLFRAIRRQLSAKDLPDEFLFIALQESNFDPTKVGPSTRFGIAKGMWQFIPPTAREYGLEVGPLQDRPELDPFDKRHDPVRSTMAAANYLAKLYATKAAASGLLVMASYNYGPTRITKNLDDLPNNPRARNFWNFYRNNWIPPQTKEYVMYIFSAALVCEHPGVFGFPDMEPISREW